MKGTEQTSYGDTIISTELWLDPDLVGFSEEVVRVFEVLRGKGYSSMVVHAAMTEKLEDVLTESTVSDFLGKLDKNA